MTDDDLTRLRDEVAEVVMDAQCAACGHEAGDHSWYGPCLVNVTNYDDACPCRRSREHVYADALLPLLARKIAEARCPLTEHDGTHGPLIRQAKSEALRGARFRVEVACDGYEALTEADVPDEMWSPSSYIAGAAEAAREIRATLAEPTGPEGER